ncbi:alpha/beta hydrolase [Chryseobacterium lactis]|uniref:Alpha/beta hydrolase n=1 Tax=Chryseobacterium lactis TaxID=1241981 RepID=A0A3G6RGD3_CHRLC|nr:alpha/beta hydrolase [Chryseobacterium lactis]AZA82532.1 alpha/beta hydrolase [Chryseobacterium lactis]AZB02913.1 alpha/beta hydrolase [Chryseobacterium lactis]PNW13792.1 alpha/beta hydrolase [Chryseobacterium lactis]
MTKINNISMNRFLTNLFFVLFLSTSHLLFSQSFSQSPVKTERVKSTLLPEIATVSENIEYKINKKGKSLALDLYIPKAATAEKLPVLIYVHGGGWIEGDKTVHADDYLESTIVKLMAKQYAVISINYTLLNDSTHFPLPLEDTKDAIRWVRKNAEKYNFDTNNIGLFGASAGAHLSLLAAYTPDNTFIGSPELSTYSAKVNYVVDHYGPADMNKLFHTRLGTIPVALIGMVSKKIVSLQQGLVKGLSGYDIQKDQDRAIDYLKTISPVTYAADGVPTLIVQGNKDKIVPLSQAKKLHRKLNRAKVQNSLVIIDNGVHSFSTTDKAGLDKITDQTVDFIVSQKK